MHTVTKNIKKVQLTQEMISLKIECKPKNLLGLLSFWEKQNSSKTAVTFRQNSDNSQKRSFFDLDFL